jgi:hypothetical protein
MVDFASGGFRHFAVRHTVWFEAKSQLAKTRNGRFTEGFGTLDLKVTKALLDELKA